MLGITFTCFAKLIYPKQLQVKLRASATVTIKQYLSLSMARDHFQLFFVVSECEIMIDSMFLAAIFISCNSTLNTNLFLLTILAKLYGQWGEKCAFLRNFRFPSDCLHILEKIMYSYKVALISSFSSKKLLPIL